MILSILVDLSVKTAWWVTKNAYYAGRYMIYGRRKTETEKLEEKLEEVEQILEDEKKLVKTLVENQKKIFPNLY